MERKDTKVTPGNVPSREYNVVQRPLAGKKETEVISEQPVPYARRIGKANTPDVSSRENQVPRGSAGTGKAPTAQHEPRKKSFTCVFCLEKGETQADHHTSECHRWNKNELPTAQKWEILIRNEACLKCLDLGHSTSKCPEKVRSCSNCQVTHGPILLCRSEVKAVKEDSTPDKPSRESKVLQVHASTRKAPTVPQPKGA